MVKNAKRNSVKPLWHTSTYNNPLYIESSGPQRSQSRRTCTSAPTASCRIHDRQKQRNLNFHPNGQGISRPPLRAVCAVGRHCGLLCRFNRYDCRSIGPAKRCQLPVAARRIARVSASLCVEFLELLVCDTPVHSVQTRTCTPKGACHPTLTTPTISWHFSGFLACWNW